MSFATCVPRSQHLHLLPLESSVKSFHYAVAISLFHECLQNDSDGGGGILAELDAILAQHFILEPHGDEAASSSSTSEDWLHKLNIETSALTNDELKFVLDNAPKLDFCVNLLGIWRKKIYPIALGIGEASSVKARRTHVVNIFKITLHREDMPACQQEHMLDARWLDLMQNQLSNINKTELEALTFQRLKESQHEIDDRLAVRQRFGRELSYKSKDDATLIHILNQREQEVHG